MKFFKKMHNAKITISKLWIIIISFMLVATTVTSIVAIVGWTADQGGGSIKNELKNENAIEPILPNKYLSTNADYALKFDAIEKSKTDSLVIYYVSWSGVLHKFGFLIHLLTMLNENPNKKTLIYADMTAYNFTFLTLYPNVKVNHISHSAMSFNDIQNQRAIDNEFIKAIDIQSENNLIDLYIPDLTIFCALENIMNTDKLNATELTSIINQFGSLLYKTLSINVFSDGSSSYVLWSSYLYKLFGLTGNSYYISNNSFACNEIYYSKYKSSIKNKTLSASIFSNYSDLFYFLFSPFVSVEKDNSYQRSKIFLPSTQLIEDINNNESSDAVLKKETRSNYFSPYNSLNGGVISTLKSFSDKQRSELLVAMKTSLSSLHKDQSEFDFMDNKLNLVYSGRLLKDLDALNFEKECRKILKLYSAAINKYPSKDVQFIFKGHPRDDDNETLLRKLKTKISELTGVAIENIGWLFLVDKQVPFELYIGCDIFLDYIDKNREFKLFGSLSTIYLMTYEYNKSINVESYLFTESENTLINSIFGPNSTVFPKEKRVIS